MLSGVYVIVILRGFSETEIEPNRPTERERDTDTERERQRQRDRQRQTEKQTDRVSNWILRSCQQHRLHQDEERGEGEGGGRR